MVLLLVAVVVLGDERASVTAVDAAAFVSAVMGVAVSSLLLLFPTVVADVVALGSIIEGALVEEEAPARVIVAVGLGRVAEATSGKGFVVEVAGVDRLLAGGALVTVIAAGVVAGVVDVVVVEVVVLVVVLVRAPAVDVNTGSATTAKPARALETLLFEEELEEEEEGLKRRMHAAIAPAAIRRTSNTQRPFAKGPRHRLFRAPVFESTFTSALLDKLECSGE